MSFVYPAQEEAKNTSANSVPDEILQDGEATTRNIRIPNKNPHGSSSRGHPSSSSSSSRVPTQHPLLSLVSSSSSSAWQQGMSNVIAQQKMFASLIQHKRLPECGWDDWTIQSFLQYLSSLDTNSKKTTVSSSSSLGSVSSSSSSHTTNRWCGVGEREGRVYSPLVASRHFGLSHGMGRSGDIMEGQPKAIGSSVLVQVTTGLVLDVLRRGCGLSGAAMSPTNSRTAKPKKKKNSNRTTFR